MYPVDDSERWAEEDVWTPMEEFDPPFPPIKPRVDPQTPLENQPSKMREVYAGPTWEWDESPPTWEWYTAVKSGQRYTFTAEEINKMSVEEYTLARGYLQDAMQRQMAKGSNITIGPDSSNLTCMWCAAPYPSVEALEVHEDECSG